MANEQNLKPHKFTREDSIKGGKSKSLAKGLSRRIWCNSRCKLYPCWAEPLSHSQFNGKCGLKHWPVKIQRRTLDFYIKGQIGFARQLIELLTELSTRVALSDDTEQMRKYIQDIINVYRTIYGTKTIFEGKIEQKGVTLEDFKKVFRRVENEIKKNRNNQTQTE